MEYAELRNQIKSGNQAMKERPTYVGRGNRIFLERDERECVFRFGERKIRKLGGKKNNTQGQTETTSIFYLKIK